MRFLEKKLLGVRYDNVGHPSRSFVPIESAGTFLKRLLGSSERASSVEKILPKNSASTISSFDHLFLLC